MAYGESCGPVSHRAGRWLVKATFRLRVSESKRKSCPCRSVAVGPAAPTRTAAENLTGHGVLYESPSKQKLVRADALPLSWLTPPAVENLTTQKRPDQPARIEQVVAMPSEPTLQTESVLADATPPPWVASGIFEVGSLQKPSVRVEVSRVSRTNQSTGGRED